MAQRVQVTLLDDVDGTGADESVRFGLDGVTYEIDLSDQNAKRLRAILAGYIPHARRTGGRKTRRPASEQPRASVPTPVDKARNTKIREWARANGHMISDRGRIPDAIQEEYEKTGGKAPVKPAAKPTVRKSTAAARKGKTPEKTTVKSARTGRRSVAVPAFSGVDR